jgi:hypothetical protein
MLRYATPNGHQLVPLRNSHMDRTSLDQGCQRWGLRLMVSHVFRSCIMRVSVYRATLVRSIPVQALPHLGSNKQITVLDLRPRPTQPTVHVQNKALLWVLSSLSFSPDAPASSMWYWTARQYPTTWPERGSTEGDREKVGDTKAIKQYKEDVIPHLDNPSIQITSYIHPLTLVHLFS